MDDGRSWPLQRVLKDRSLHHFTEHGTIRQTMLLISAEDPVDQFEETIFQVDTWCFPQRYLVLQQKN
jgi:hypothetical protein